MVRYGNIASQIIVTVVTCGIYGFVWLSSLADDVNELSGQDEKNNLSGAMTVLFTILTCGIYRIYWAYKAGEMIDKAKRDRGMSSSDNLAIVYLVLAVLSYFTGITGIVMYALMQDEINKFVNDKT